MCFRLAVSSRRLADAYVSRYETAYSLDDCKDFCRQEEAFLCRGFAYRRPLSQGEILNCDLTGEDPSALDEYNSYHFHESAVTDFYERVDCSAMDVGGAGGGGVGERGDERDDGARPSGKCD